MLLSTCAPTPPPSAHCSSVLHRLSSVGMLTKSSKLSDIASGISYLHENNIVHGDLKGVRSFSCTHLAPVLTKSTANCH